MSVDRVRHFKHAYTVHMKTTKYLLAKKKKPFSDGKILKEAYYY